MHTWRSIAIATVVAAVMLASPALFASNRKAPDANGETANVIAHVPLSGPSATRIFEQIHHGRKYLYVDQGEANAVTVIDVSQPSHPVVVRRTSWPNDSAAGEVHFLGSDLAISQSPSERPVSQTPTTLNILDVADAGRPTVLQTFSGVTSVLSDQARNLLYVANHDGLWILRHQVTQRAYAWRHMCTSEDAINPVPDCY